MLLTYLKWAWRAALTGLVLGAPLVILVALFAMPRAPRMRAQQRLKPFEESSFFGDERSMRRPPEETIPRATPAEDPAFSWGRTRLPSPGEEPELLPLEARQTAQSDEKTRYIDRIPIEISEKLLYRGQNRFDIYCALCHGGAGDARGIIPRHGFPRPPTFHSTRLREAPDGYLFNVITLGYGMMYDYADRITPADRWAIVAYIRALQFSQHARAGALGAQDLQKLEEADR